MSGNFGIHYVHLKHEGGSKEYRLLRITNKTTCKEVLIQQWGKIGASGQSKIDAGSDAIRGGMEKSLRAKVKAKSAGGYREIVDTERAYASLDEVSRGFGHMTARLSGQQFSFIDGGLSEDSATASARPEPAAPPSFDEMPDTYGSW